MEISPWHIVTAAAVVLNKDNEILLLKGSKRGWEIPGGRVEEGESISSGSSKRNQRRNWNKYRNC